MIDTCQQHHQVVAMERFGQDSSEDRQVQMKKRNMEDDPREAAAYSSASFTSSRSSSSFSCCSDDSSSSRKQVRFATTDCGSVKTDLANSNLSESDLDKEMLWWSFEEQQDTTEHSRSIVRKFKDYHGDQVERFANVFDKWSKANPEESSSDDTTRNCTNPSCSSDDAHNDSFIMPTIVRGLESGTVPWVLEQRRNHVRNVLTAQNQVTGRLNPDLRHRVLGSRAMKSSRPSRVIARQLAHGDALAVSRDVDVQMEGVL